MNDLIKNNAMAEMLGMTPAAFARGVKRGRFTPEYRDEFGDGLYDPEKVKKQFKASRPIAETQNHAALMPVGLQGGRPKKIDSPENSFSGGDDSEKYLRAKLAKEAINARLLELKYKVRMGELIEKTEVQKQGEELGAIMIGEIQSWAHRLSPELAGMKDADEHDINQRLLKECNNLIISIRKRCGLDTVL
jgi:hypothetical protein